tara:strand:- start:740 stop:1072 length:333 start_codon:yes stop_codon:yes gene_type:complete
MFDDLFSFNKERLPLQALAFYIVFFIIGLVLGGLGGFIFASDFESGVLVGQVIAPIYCLVLGILILSQKDQLSSAHSSALFIVAILAYFFGVLGGLIPVAYLSTIKNLTS